MTDIQRIRDNLQSALNMGGLREAAERAISELDKIPEGFALVPVERLNKSREQWQKVDAKFCAKPVCFPYCDCGSADDYVPATPSEDGREVPIQRVDVEMLKGGRWRWIDTPDGLVVRHTDHVTYVQRIVAEKDAEIARLKGDMRMLEESHHALFDELRKRDFAQPARQVGDDWPKLEKPAKVGGVRFNVGVSARLVVEAAQRQYEYDVTPEKEADRIAKAADFLGSLQGGRQGGGDEREQFCAWFKSRHGYAAPTEYHGDGFEGPFTNGAWQGWKARSAIDSNAIPVELLKRLSKLFPEDMGDDGSGRAGWLPHVRETICELRALLGKD